MTAFELERASGEDDRGSFFFVHLYLLGTRTRLSRAPPAAPLIGQSPFLGRPRAGPFFFLYSPFPPVGRYACLRVDRHRNPWGGSPLTRHGYRHPETPVGTC